MKLIKNMVFMTLAAGVLCLTACSTGALLPELKVSLNDIRQSVSNLCGGTIRRSSENGREMWSPYFGRNQGDKTFDPKTSKERLTAHFMVWGDRRPFEIRVEVRSEKKGSHGYEDAGEDKVLSQKIADELEVKLSESPDNRNVIDDFRPF